MSSLNLYNIEEFHYDPLYISEDSIKLFLIVFEVIIFGAISLAGVVSNIINIVIFMKLVLRDSMTVGLFALVLSNFFITILELTISCIYAASILCPWSPVDLWALAYGAIAWAVYAGYLISCWITAMISLERCLCVVSPFKVKQVFTRERCAFVVIIIYFIIIFTFLSIFIVERMEWVPLGVTCVNVTVGHEKLKWFYTIVFTDAALEVETALDITAGLFLSTSAQFVLLICSLWMTVSLKSSSTVRTKKVSPKRNAVLIFGTNSNLTAHEKRLIKMVLFISVGHSVCNLPRLTVTIFVHVFTGFSIEDHKNFSTIIWTPAVFFNNVTFSCNSMRYYFLNSAYRRTLRKIFNGQKRDRSPHIDFL